MNDILRNEDASPVELSAESIEAVKETPRQRAFKKFSLAAINAIPWIGGFIVAAIESRDDPHKVDDLLKQWIEHHARKLNDLRDTLRQISDRLANFGDEINTRIESPEFLGIVDKAFRAWDEAATKQKQDSVRRLITNAAATSLCSDDLVRLFLEWIRKYEDTHFRVIEAIYRRPGINRRDIWLSMHPTIPRDTSSEADLFKLLIHDLSLGHVIRQQRHETPAGQFLKTPNRGRGSSSRTMKSPFDADEPYELTELGQQFVHYVMDEVAPQIGGERRAPPG